MAKLIVGQNDLATVTPDLAAEWHSTMNGSLLPSQITYGSSKRVWWLGKCGHEWEAVISRRSGRGDGCPLCRKSRPKTHEEFCKSINKINPFIEITGTYVKSNVRVSVRCKKCGFEWSTKPNTLQQGSGCPRCAKTGTSRSEQYLCVFMEQVFGIESVLNRDKTSIGLELDVVCGKHAWEYGSWFWHKPKRKQAIDLEKYERCRERGITLHIIYDSCAGERSKIPSSVCFDYDLWQEIDHKSLKRICIKGAKEISPDVDLSSIDWESIEIESARRCRALSSEEYSAEVESIYNGKIIIDSASFKSIANRVKAHCTSCGKTWSSLAYGSEIVCSQDKRFCIPCHHEFIEIVRVNRKIVFPYVIDRQDSDENMHTRLSVPRDIDLIGAHIIPSFTNETSMHQLKGRHGLIVSRVLSLAVYAQLPLFALDFCHGIQNESSSQREGSNKHERHG